jgi:DNA-binding GntR family transcriptional regulator
MQPDADPEADPSARELETIPAPDRPAPDTVVAGAGCAAPRPAVKQGSTGLMQEPNGTRTEKTVSFAIDYGDHRPRYQQLADYWSVLIRDGVLSPGQPFPGELTLAAEYGVSVGTVRAARRVLKERNLITVVPGKGVFVATGAPIRPRYVAIADDIAAKVANGTLSRKGPLPNERFLAEEYEAALGTIRHAITILQERGTLVSTRGVGTFITPDKTQ